MCVSLVVSIFASYVYPFLVSLAASYMCVSILVSLVASFVCVPFQGSLVASYVCVYHSYSVL